MDPRSPSYIRSPHCAQQGDASLTHWPSSATQLWWSVCSTRISCYIFTVAKKEHLCFVSRKKVVNHHCHEKEGFYSPSSSAPEIIASTYLCLLHAIIVTESGTLPSKLTRVVQLRSFMSCQSVESRQRNSTNEQTNKRKKRHVDARVHWDGSRLKKGLSSIHCRVYNQYFGRPDDGAKTIRGLTVSETG